MDDAGSEPSQRHRLWPFGVVLLLGVVVGAVAGALFTSDANTVTWRQYYGVARGYDEQGRFCIENSDSGVRCALARLDERAKVPADGFPVRGGYTELPSDTSDPPEPTWIWITELACGWDGTEQATECPEG